MTKFLEEVLHRHFGTAEARAEMAEDFAALICLLIFIGGIVLALPFLAMPLLENGGAQW